MQEAIEPEKLDRTDEVNVAVNVKAMDAKKNERVAASGIKGSKKGEAFLTGIKSEFKKITWTDKEQLMTYTKVVVGATFFCGMGIYAVDVVIRSALSTLEYIGHTIFG